MEIGPISAEKDNRAALAEINACRGAPEGSKDGDRLDVLLALVDIYEAKFAKTNPMCAGRPGRSRG